jgi:hypothetical protein
VGSELLTEGSLVALEVSLVSLRGALDLDPSPLRLLREGPLGDERLDLLPLRLQICSWSLVSCAARAMPTSSAVIISPSPSAGGSSFGAV